MNTGTYTLIRSGLRTSVLNVGSVYRKKDNNVIAWIKVRTGIFDDEKIRLIEAMPDADALLVIWFKLLVQAGRCNANGNVTLTNGRPFSDEMLSVLFSRPVNTVRLALQTFRDFGMIDDTDGIIKIPNWGKHQNVQALEKIREQTRARVAQYRERQKQKLLEGEKPESNATVTLPNALDKKKKKEYTSDILRLSDFLAQRILLNNPKHSRLSNGKYQECVQLWAKDIDRLHRLDKQSIEDIRKVIEWCQTEPFWKTNILSGASLRKQWDRLYIAASQSGCQSLPGKIPESDNVLKKIQDAKRRQATETAHG